MVLPKLRPISAICLGPNTKAATPATTANSGTPSPNTHRQVHEKPFLRVGFPGRTLVKDRREPLLLTDLREPELELLWVINKAALEAEMGSVRIGERERVVDSDETSISDFGGRVKVGFFWDFD